MVKTLGQFGLGGIALGFLGYVTLNQIPAMAVRIDANTTALHELRIEMARARLHQAANNPWAEEKVKAAIPPE